jgi:phasin
MSQTGKSTKSSAADAMDAFSIGLQNVEIPPIFRDIADRTMDQAKDVYARTTAAAAEATDFIDGAYETARQNVRSLSAKAIEAAKTNADAGFALFRDLLGARTFADAIEVQTAFTRKQFEVATAQLREFQEASQKAFFEAAKPAREAVEKTFASAAKAAA